MTQKVMNYWPKMIIMEIWTQWVQTGNKNMDFSREISRQKNPAQQITWLREEIISRKCLKPEINEGKKKRNQWETPSKTNICISNYGPRIKLLVQIKTGSPLEKKMEWILSNRMSKKPDDIRNMTKKTCFFF